MDLKSFHSASAARFKGAFDIPTEIQTRAWPEIRRRKNTLISAPTGSGKTLAAGLCAIDGLVRQSLGGRRIKHESYMCRCTRRSVTILRIICGRFLKAYGKSSRGQGSLKRF